MNIEILEERIIKLEEFFKMSYEELIKLREELDNRYYWRITTENYNKQKLIYLNHNEHLIDKVIYEKI